MSDTPSQPTTRRGSAGRIAGITAIALLCLTTASLLAVWLAHMRFSTPTASMAPTLLVGDYLLASRAWWDPDVERGDVIVFDINLRSGQSPVHYIKRVIGMPGDRIALRDGVVSINGTPVERRPVDPIRDDAIARPVPAFEETLPGGRKFTVLEAVDDGTFDTMAEITVPDEHYFVIGDNRDNSYDSRALNKIGFVAREAIAGKARRLYFSWGDRGLRRARIGQAVR